MNRQTTAALGFAAALSCILIGCSGEAGSAPTSGAELSAPATNASSERPASASPSAAENNVTAAGQSVTLGLDEETDIMIAGNTEVVCEGGGEVRVRADDAIVTTNGDCEELTVFGSSSTLTAESAHELDVTGSNNDVLINEVREVGIDGNHNRLVLGAVLEIDLDGDNNTVRVESGDPRIDDRGAENAVTGMP